MDTSLSLQVITSLISGSVSLGGSPVYQAQVSAQGNTATSFNGTRTDAAGHYALYGLKAGAVYNLYVSFVASATQAQINSSTNNVTAPALIKNFNLQPGTRSNLGGRARRAPATVFGNVTSYTANFNQNIWGNVRLLAGATTLDNGDSLTLPPGRFSGCRRVPIPCT